MVSFIIAFAIITIVALLVLILGSLRWKVGKIPVKSLEEMVLDLEDFAKLLKEEYGDAK